MAWRRNTGGLTTGATVRLSSGAPDLRTRRFAFVWFGAIDKQPASETALFFVRGPDGEQDLLTGKITAGGDITVKFGGTTAFAAATADTNFGDGAMATGTRIPVMVFGIITDFNASHLDLRVCAAGRTTASPAQAGVFTASIPNRTGEWGFGSMSGTLDVAGTYTDNSRVGIEDFGLAIHTYAASAGVPTLDEIEAACWNPHGGGGGHIENVFEGAVWSLHATPESYLLCPGMLTNANINQSFVGTGVGSNLTTSGCVATWPTTGSLYQSTTWTITGTHAIIDPFDDHPGVLAPITTAYSPNATIAVGGVGDGLYALLNETYTGLLRVAVFGQSWSGGYPDCDNIAGNVLWQGMLLEDIAHAAGILLDGIVDSNTGAFANRDGRRLGFDASNGAETWSHGTIVQTSSVAYGWGRFAASGRNTNSTGVRLTIGGGNTWTGDNSGSNEVYTATFERFGLITDATPVTIGLLVAEHAYGAATVTWQAETCKTTNNGAAHQTFAGGTTDLETLGESGAPGISGAVVSFTGGTVVSQIMTTRDTMVVSGGDAASVSTAEIAAFAADPVMAEHCWAAWCGDNDDIAVITGASYNAGTGNWTLTFDGGWATQTIPAAGNLVFVGRFRVKRLEVTGVLDATDTTYNLVRIRVTKTGGSGGGPIRVLGRYAWGEGLIGFVAGGFGCGGMSYDHHGKYTQPGFPERLAAVMGADVAVMGNTAIPGGAGWFTTEIARLSGLGLEVMGVFVPVWITAVTSPIVADQQDTLRAEFMAAATSAGVPALDGADLLGSPVTQMLRGHRADITHFSSRGYAALWTGAKAALLPLVTQEPAATTGGGAARNRSRSRARFSAVG